MIASSSPILERGLDTMILVYSMLQGHPGQAACEQFLRTQSGWFTSPFVLFEAKSVLTKIYGVDRLDVTGKLSQFASLPVAILDLPAAGTISVFQLADTHHLDLTDAVLLHLAQTHATTLATEDQHLAHVCAQLGITTESPLDATLRQEIATWEVANLPAKGLARVLSRVHQWLGQKDSQAARDFWSQTGNGSHLP